MQIEAIVLAGGLGTRLKSVLHNIPKCMAPVNEKPFLHFVLKYLKNQGVERVILSIGYMKEQIVDYFMSENDIEIVFAPENEPLGTGGAIKNAMRFCKSENPFVLNGDTLFNADLKEMCLHHSNKQSDITIAVRQIEDVSRYGEIEFDEDYKIINFREKSEVAKQGFINGGTYICKKSVIENFKKEIFSLEKDFLTTKVDILGLSAFISNTGFLDIGIPSDYAKASEFVYKLDL